MLIGKQKKGTSSSSIKEMTIRAVDCLMIDTTKMVTGDIGCGGGELSGILEEKFHYIEMLDYGNEAIVPQNARFQQCDLNGEFPLHDNSLDFLFSLEVIEHLENPRHFFREICRVLKSGGYGFVTTPNNETFFSKLNFVLRNSHRYFSDNGYPGHITPILHIEFKRMLQESGLVFINFFYNNEEWVPILNKKLLVAGGKLFSSNYGVLFQKEKI